MLKAKGTEVDNQNMDRQYKGRSEREEQGNQSCDSGQREVETTSSSANLTDEKQETVHSLAMAMVLSNMALIKQKSALLTNIVFLIYIKYNFKFCNISFQCTFTE